MTIFAAQAADNFIHGRGIELRKNYTLLGVQVDGISNPEELAAIHEAFNDYKKVSPVLTM